MEREVLVETTLRAWRSIDSEENTTSVGGDAARSVCYEFLDWLGDRLLSVHTGKDLTEPMVYNQRRNCTDTTGIPTMGDDWLKQTCQPRGYTPADKAPVELFANVCLRVYFLDSHVGGWGA